MSSCHGFSKALAQAAVHPQKTRKCSYHKDDDFVKRFFLKTFPIWGCNGIPKPKRETLTRQSLECCDNTTHHGDQVLRDVVTCEM